MSASQSTQPIQSPERLDTRFGLVVGCYVAALVSPALLFAVADRLRPDSALVVLGLLAAVVVAVVTWGVTRWGSLVERLDSPVLLWLLPAIGVLPFFAYGLLALVFLGTTIASLEIHDAAPAIGFAGVVLGIVAMCLGGGIVAMARTRLAAASVGDEFDVEWSASWPRRARFKLGGAMLGVLLPLCGFAVWYLGLQAMLTVVPAVLPLQLGVQNVADERTYRVSPAGLEQRQEGRWTTARRFIPWSQFEGFSVTDDGLVLHRPRPSLDIRCSKWDLDTAEADVIAALEEHLNPTE
ncbi:hypothetical protein [Haloarchaeobius sp. DFWS5]|uniref:hypothetical protein n=1 Tax=Haloarchaeobius sp. DFWS5 TaxID=3446114 RepID=UPI003EB90377